ncbi:MAG: hypothetical protein ACYTF9_10625 [Planctomycetota bacterium]|jgi:hypothetical protein
MLSDRLLADADFVASFESRSTTSASRLWPWVAQAMRGGGIYGWNRLDGPTSRPSPWLLDGLPSPRVGDRLGDLFEICRLDRQAEIVWRNIRPLAFLDSMIHDLTLDYRVEAIRSGGARLAARIRCVADGRSQPMTNYATTTLAYILPCCQVRNLAQHGDLDGQGKRLRRAATIPFQHLPLIPARPSRRRSS